HIQLDVTRGRDELTISVRLARMPRGPAPATTTSSTPTTTPTPTPSTTQ
ncbi:MAG: hypothetical protein QOF28_1084, partial [Actinomycetota bacterium]|nr:hypothetical protein [Actinomycetota bacterium]